MVDATFAVKQDVFLAGHLPIFVECIHENALSESILLRFLDSCPDGKLGVAPVYGSRCVLTSMAFSTPFRALLIRFSGPKATKQHHMERPARELLRDLIFCHPQRQIYGFQMDRIAIALYLDLSLRIRAGVDLLSASKRNNRHSLDALMDVLGGEHTLNKLGVKALFRHREGAETKQCDTALQAWVASQASKLVTMSRRVLAVPRIDTYTMLDTVLCYMLVIWKSVEP
ncbi:hypothetical protein BJ138DRAFT_604646 [Hygrophoropsis aurantiaca]|uniref:Uncharacterized protein n=1 Tax=Hygrophoropsis aurantiaca TaxID=72124 RepID=A0ACB8AJD6_9AGAM|nr:hypothetical protein BJ138DRAFT_604646 [Hygrophoropsis aurantiaca]